MEGCNTWDETKNIIWKREAKQKKKRELSYEKTTVRKLY